MRGRAVEGQLDLLEWQPPNPVARFDDFEVRGLTFSERLSSAISTTLKSCGRPREEVARRMSDRLGRSISINVLNAYASPQRETHQISVPRFVALLHATEDRRLVELLAEPLGWATIERKHLPLIELAAIHEHLKELRRHEDRLRRQSRGRRG
ncbi:phage regulatory CII family protein [Acidisoma sp. 7E03]